MERDQGERLDNILEMLYIFTDTFVWSCSRAHGIYFMVVIYVPGCLLDDWIIKLFPLFYCFYSSEFSRRFIFLMKHTFIEQRLSKAINRLPYLTSTVKVTFHQDINYHALFFLDYSHFCRLYVLASETLKVTWWRNGTVNDFSMRLSRCLLRYRSL